MRESEPERLLSDNEAFERIHAAREALGSEGGATVHADTALSAARKALAMLSLALVAASDRANGDLD